MGIDVAEIVGPILAHFNAKFDTLQKNIDSRFDQLDMRIESIERSDRKRGLSYECDESMLSISNEPRMVAQLAALKESSGRSSLKDEAEELRTLKAWAGSEDSVGLEEQKDQPEDLKEIPSPLIESFMEPEVEIQSRDNSSRCSFSILPSDIPPLENEQNNDAGDVYDSEDSFEEITSNVINDLDKSDLTLVEGETQEDDDIIDEDEVLSRSTERRLSSISDEERSKISEAVSAQAKAIQELMNSNKFASISRSNSTVSGISSLDQVQIQEIQEVTEAEIQRIAQDCLESGMIKKSAHEGLEYIPPVNTRETSLDPTSVLASDQSVENNPIWVDSGSDLDSTTNQIEELPSYADTMAPPTRPLPEEPEWRPTSPRPLPNVIDESDFAPAQETVLNAHASEFTPRDQFVPRDLQIDLNQDQAILENLNLDEPIQTETNRSIDFTPVNGLQQLKREFGDEYEQLYGVCLRKFDYDAGRAAEYIRKNQLTSKLLAAKMQLSDYDITPEEYSLSEMVVHIDKINEIITAYIEHEFQERTIVNVPNGRPNPPNLWDNVRQFITQSVRF